MDYSVQFPKLGWDFNLNPVAFKIGGFEVAWYGVIISAGMLLALLYAYSHAKKFFIDADKMTDCVIGGIIGAIVGARAYYVLMRLDEYKTLKDVINIRNGGLAVYGGIIGAFLTAAVVAKVRKMSRAELLSLFDVAGIGLLIGQSVGRWGNFFNQEAFGTNTNLPWGMTSPRVKEYLWSIAPTGISDNGAAIDFAKPVHPCFLYESLWCILGFILLSFYAKKVTYGNRYPGKIILMYIGWYGLGRFFIEGLRTDSLYLGNVRVSQLVACVCVITSIVLIAIFNRKFKANSAPDGGVSSIVDDVVKNEVAESLAENLEESLAETEISEN